MRSLSNLIFVEWDYDLSEEVDSFGHTPDEPFGDKRRVVEMCGRVESIAIG